MLKKFSLFQRLILANLLYAIPVISLIYLMVQAQNVNIDFAIQETKGNAIQRPLENLLQSVLEARTFSPGSNSAAERIKQIDGQLNALESAFETYGEDLQFNEEGLKKRGREQILFASFKKRWLDFVAKTESLNQTGWVEAITPFVADLRTMITHAGDTSNLILDPDLDSYYLMDVTLLALPQSQDRISEIMAFVRGRVQNLSSADRIQLAVYAALAKQSDLDRVTADLQTTLNEDPNFFGESATLKTKLAPAVTQYQAAMDKFIQALSALSTGDEKAPSFGEFYKLGNQALDESFKSWNVAVGELDVLLDTRLATLKAQKQRSLSIALAALAVAVMILFWISSSFNRNMTVVISRLRDLVSKSRDSGDHLVTTSEELSISSIEQTEALQQTSAAMEQIRSMIQATVANATEAKDSAENSLSRAEAGQGAVQKLIQAIQEISESNKLVLQQMEQNKTEMSEITNIISEISGKTKVINDIVFQTKLLSFNASVEAARAGEAGKGFSVVAEEVGNLAQMSGGASNEISQMLHASIQRVEGITSDTHAKVDRMMSSTQSRVTTGVQLANECTSAIESVLVRFQDVLKSTDSIHQAAIEQAKGIDEVNKAVIRLETVSQKNHQASRRTAEQSRDIAGQARELDSVAHMIHDEIMGAGKARPTMEDQMTTTGAPTLSLESSFNDASVGKSA